MLRVRRKFQRSEGVCCEGGPRWFDELRPPTFLYIGPLGDSQKKSTLMTISAHDGRSHASGTVDITDGDLLKAERRPYPYSDVSRTEDGFDRQSYLMGASWPSSL